MKSLYLDCSMGAAGDMLTAALLELLPHPEKFLRKLNGLEIPGVEFAAEESEKCGIHGTHMRVMVQGQEEESHDHHDHDHEHHDHEHHDHEHHDHEHHDHEHHDHEHHDHEQHDHDHEHHTHHHHSSMADVEHIISHIPVSQKVKQDAIAVYRMIAEAESHAHGKPVEQIHFHEVGTMDAIADVVAVCLLMEEIGPCEVTASPVHVGSGQVRCAHGILPVPAPATAYILKDVPIYGGSIRGELCTPTGAALLKHFVTKFGEMPIMQVKAIGYGCGKKDFPAANCVRAMLGESEDMQDRIVKLECNVDDCTAEQLGYACERIFAAGAVEVFTQSVQMKKSRPGTLLSAICREDKKEAVVQAIFLHTTTIGIREDLCSRYVLEREIKTCDTPMGKVRFKISSGYGVRRVKAEYDDLAKIAEEKGISLEEARKAAEAFFKE